MREREMLLKWHYNIHRTGANQPELKNMAKGPKAPVTPVPVTPVQM
jgi:hypothetical protein